MSKPYIVSYILGLLMVLSAALTLVITPSVDIAGAQSRINLEAMIPSTFGDWKFDSSAVTLMINPDAKEMVNKLYSQTLSRTYTNNQGERVMLSIAYGMDQKKDLQVHRPEICYLSGGFSVSKLTKTFVDTTIGRIPVLRLIAKQGARIEPITYWIRVGDSLTRGWFEQKMALITYGLTGEVPDGLLFRVSTISSDEQESYRIQQEFLSTLLQAVKSEDRYWLVGRLAPAQ